MTIFQISSLRKHSATKTSKRHRNLRQYNQNRRCDFKINCKKIAAKFFRLKRPIFYAVFPKFFTTVGKAYWPNNSFKEPSFFTLLVTLTPASISLSEQWILLSLTQNCNTLAYESAIITGKLPENCLAIACRYQSTSYIASFS